MNSPTSSSNPHYRAVWLFALLGILTPLTVLADAKALFKDGYDLLQAGKASQAVSKFEEGLKDQPNDAQANFYLAEAYRKLGKNATAKMYYEKSLKLDPNSKVAAQAKQRVAGSGATSSPTFSGAVQKIDGWNNVKFGMTREQVKQSGIGELNENDWFCEAYAIARYRAVYPGCDCKILVTDATAGGIEWSVFLRFAEGQDRLKEIELSAKESSATWDNIKSLRMTLEGKYGKAEVDGKRKSDGLDECKEAKRRMDSGAVEGAGAFTYTNQRMVFKIEQRAGKIVGEYRDQHICPNSPFKLAAESIRMLTRPSLSLRYMAKDVVIRDGL